MHPHPAAAARARMILAATAASLMAACGGADGSADDPTAPQGAAGEAQAVAYDIPPDGGTLVALGTDGTIVTLHLPTGALAQTTRIRVAPQAHGGVLLQPAGLALQSPAELVIEPATASVPALAAVRVTMTEFPAHVIAGARQD